MFFGFKKVKEGEETKPKDSLIRKVIIPGKIYSKAVEIGNKAGTEVGFYMIGYVEGSTAYILDLIEFPYSEKTAVSVASSIEGQAKIGAITPLGLNIIGTMHKHPDGIGSSFSGIDRKTYIQWAKVTDKAAHVIFSRNGKDVSAYTVYNGEVNKIGIEIVDSSKIEIESYIVKLTTHIPLVVKKGSSNLKIASIITRDIESKLLKHLSKIKLDKKGEILELKETPPVFIKFPDRGDILYEIFCEEDIKTVRDLKYLVKKLFNLDKEYIAKIDGKELSDDQDITTLTFKTITFEESPREMLARLVEEKISDIVIILRELKNSIKPLSSEISTLKKEIDYIKKELKRIEDLENIQKKQKEIIYQLEERAQRLESIQDNLFKRINSIEEELQKTKSVKDTGEEEIESRQITETPGESEESSQKSINNEEPEISEKSLSEGE